MPVKAKCYMTQASPSPVSPAPRIAVGGFMLESNSHSPVATRAEFTSVCDLRGAALEVDWSSKSPTSSTTIKGFVAGMNQSGPWRPVPLLHAQANASGAVDQAYFDEVVKELCDRVRAALPLDGVFLALHGAAIATADHDPDGTILESVRAIVGPGVPVVATLDLHANVAERMVNNASALVAYRTNPHVDMRERGAECAAILRDMIAGMQTETGFVKLPFVPPSVTQNTHAGPYHDLIEYGQQQIDKDIVNVSVLSGFTLGDTPKNGMSVVVTARAGTGKAQSLARDIARFAWAQRHRYIPHLTSLQDATAMALQCGNDPARPALVFADVADNPGGGARGNTVWILQSFVKAGVRGAVVGPVFDPALASEAHRMGEGAAFCARFNRDEDHPLSGRFTADVVVERLHHGQYVARRGISAGNTITNGPTALLRAGGVHVVVVSRRDQARDAVQFEMLGIDLARVRALVVKSRGHFRAAFDEFFGNDQVVEVDVPGLTTPVLANVAWQRMPRPVFPLDPEMEWEPA
jgi:microcystin degradation protein MlrC